LREHDPSVTGDPDRQERRGTVFFVDDDDRLRNVTRRLLEARGFEVLEAGTAEGAIDLFDTRADDVDVVLMDIHLPDGWGGSLAQRLREIREDVPVVYTTGYADVDPILAGALKDARYVVRKPYSTDQLVTILDRAIDAG